MPGQQNMSTWVTDPIDPRELAAILAEVRQDGLAVDTDTGEHRPLRDLTLHPLETADTVAER